MNAYSKIGSTATTHKSRSIDFSDYFSFPQTPKPVPVRKTVPPTKHEQEEESNAHNCCPPQSKKEDHEGQRFGVILGRSCSVSSSSSSSSSSAAGFQATMKRAFSIRRSSSVSERYCRIHDQSMAIASDHHELELELDINIDGGDGKTTEKKKHKGGKILKACKRLLGL